MYKLQLQWSSEWTWEVRCPSDIRLFVYFPLGLANTIQPPLTFLASDGIAHSSCFFTGSFALPENKKCFSEMSEAKYPINLYLMHRLTFCWSVWSSKIIHYVFLRPHSASGLHRLTLKALSRRSNKLARSKYQPSTTIKTTNHTTIWYDIILNISNFPYILKDWRKYLYLNGIYRLWYM